MIRTTISLGFILSILVQLSAQINLQHAIIHGQLNPQAGYGLARLSNNEYAVIDEYGFGEVDLDPDPSNTVYAFDGRVPRGYYIGKYDSTGKYIDHVLLRGADLRTYSPGVVSDDQYLYITGDFKDSVSLGGLQTPYQKLEQPGTGQYIAKYNHNLELQDYYLFEEDSSYLGDLSILPNNELLLNISFRGTYSPSFKNKSVSFTAEKLFPQQNGDLLFIKMDNQFNYINHYQFEHRGGETIKQLTIDEVSGNIHALTLTTLRGDYIINDDTLKMTSNFRTFPLLIEFNNDLKINRYVNLEEFDVEKAESMTVNSQNGDFFIGGYSENKNALYLLLLDSTYQLKTSAVGEYIRSGVSTFMKKNSIGQTDEAYTVIVKGPSITFNNGTPNLNPISYLELSKDSLNVIHRTPMNDFIRDVFYNDEKGILAIAKLYGQQTIGNTFSSGPPSLLGNPLKPTEEQNAVLLYNSNCKPTEVSFEQKVLDLCADQYGTYGIPSMKLNTSGSGLSYQWYYANDTSRILLDSDPRVQGAYTAKGAQTSYYTVTSGATKYLERDFVVKVGSSCQEPIWSDTVTQRIWGTLRLGRDATTPANIYAKKNDSVTIRFWSPDLADYPADSISFEWQKGGITLTDTAKFKTLDSTYITFDSIQVEDQGEYTCRVVRNHCDDSNTQKLVKVNVNVSAVGIDERKAELYSDLFPNPVSDRLFLNFKKVPVEIQLLNQQGILIQKMNPNDQPYDVSKLVSGTYFLRLIYEDFSTHQVFIKK